MKLNYEGLSPLQRFAVMLVYLAVCIGIGYSLGGLVVWFGHTPHMPSVIAGFVLWPLINLAVMFINGVVNPFRDED